MPRMGLPRCHKMNTGLAADGSHRGWARRVFSPEQIEGVGVVHLNCDDEGQAAPHQQLSGGTVGV